MYVCMALPSFVPRGIDSALPFCRALASSRPFLRYLGAKETSCLSKQAGSSKLNGLWSVFPKRICELKLQSPNQALRIYHLQQIVPEDLFETLNKPHHTVDPTFQGPCANCAHGSARMSAGAGATRRRPVSRTGPPILYTIYYTLYTI